MGWPNGKRAAGCREPRGFDMAKKKTLATLCIVKLEYMYYSSKKREIEPLMRSKKPTQINFILWGNPNLGFRKVTKCFSLLYVMKISIYFT